MTTTPEATEAAAALDDSFHVFDTTLRDGAQREGINLTVADKLTIARHLDDFGVGFIEGGWPGANPATPSSSPARGPRSPSSTRNSSPSARPGGPAARPPRTRRSGPCWRPAPR